ncbi:hypothetical protein RINTHM_10010 [Richelia intracellularis HM01]|nr:hypothetical protein RINTHM_10010 [Richelia intracellularis HM01]
MGLHLFIFMNLPLLNNTIVIQSFFRTDYPIPVCWNLSIILTLGGQSELCTP